MRHVEAAVRTNAKSFWVFVAVLEQSPPSYAVAGKMKEAMNLQEKSESLCTETQLFDCMSCDGACYILQVHRRKVMAFVLCLHPQV